MLVKSNFKCGSYPESLYIPINLVTCLFTQCTGKPDEYLLVEFTPHSGWHIEASAKLNDVRRVILPTIHQQVTFPLLFLCLEGPDPGLVDLSVTIVSAQVVRITRFLLPPRSAFLAIFVCNSSVMILSWIFDTHPS